MTFEVLCLIAGQEAGDAAWEAWLCNRPMTWLSTPACWQFWSASAIEHAKAKR